MSFNYPEFYRRWHKSNKEDEVHIARKFARSAMLAYEVMEEGLPPIVATDHSRMRYEPRHTQDHPFCDDHRCPCHYDDTLFAEHIEQPMMAGLLTSAEANNLRWFDNI